MLSGVLYHRETVALHLGIMGNCPRGNNFDQTFQTMRCIYNVNSMCACVVAVVTRSLMYWHVYWR